MELDKATLTLIKDIPIKGIGILKQPVLLDILSIGFDNYKKMVIPFQLTLEILESEIDLSSFKTLDIFFAKDEHGELNEVSLSYLISLIQSIKYFIDTDNVDIDFHNQTILLDNKNYVNRDNFDNLADVILKITMSEKIKIEKEDSNKSERQKEIDKKLAEGRAKKQKQEAITLFDMINVLIHSENTKFDYDSILKLTYLQIRNSYEVVMNIENYDVNLACLNGFMDTSLLDLTHWSEKVRELKPKVVQEGTL